MKKIALGIFLIALVAVTTNATLGDKDWLHGKTYEVQQTEFKEGAPKPSVKPIKDEFTFNKGKLYSDFVGGDKIKFDKYLKYELKKDSTYTEEDEERHYYEIEVTSENDDGQKLEIKITVDDINIEGSIKLSKGDKLKKHYEFTGKEKPKKGKK